ncbi:MAG: fibronectin type III domain-containing protein, partial [Candidatus Marinimicrobia bacterium]|nr:fibronectin type III domain-containing protein [Candidatus Neomarinimicrobiota bacterium]
ADLDGDGDLDLVTANWDSDNISVLLNINDVTPPAAPTGLTATPGDQLVALTWSPNSEVDLSHYVVYQGIVSGFDTTGASVAQVNKPDITATITSLTNGSTYWFVVTAVDSAGNQGAASAEVSGTPVPEPPGSPALATPADSATGLNPRPTLTWNPATGAETYQLQVATSAAFSTLVFDTDSISATARQVGPLTNNRTFYWRVLAANSSGMSDYSEIWSFTTFLPPDVQQVAIIDSFDVPGSSPTGLAWDGEALWMIDNLENVYRLDTNGTVLSSFTSTMSVSDISWDGQVLWLHNGSILRAIDTTGAVVEQLSVGHWALSGMTWDGRYFWVADYNSSLVCKHARDGTILLYFGVDITSARPEALDYDGRYLLIGEGNHINRYTPTGARHYSQSLSSVGLASSGRASIAWDGRYLWYSSSGRFKIYKLEIPYYHSAPPVPTLLSPTDGAIDQDLTLSLSWSASLDAATYRLQVSTDPAINTTVFDDSTITATSVQVGPLADGTTYYWHVSAKNSGGTSAYSSIRSFTTLPDTTSPAPPTNLTATPGNQQITLTWTAPGDGDVAKYRIYRDITTPSTTLVDSVVGAPPATAFTDTGLSNGTTYYYRITALDSTGNESNYSNEVSGAPTLIISGTYTIGTGDDFATFNAAVDTLKKYGIAGPVTFLVNDETFTEQVTIPPIAGVSATDTIVFMADTANTGDATLVYNAVGVFDNWVVKIDSADYITFKDLTLGALDYTYARVIKLVGHSHNINIVGNTLVGSASTSTDTSEYRATIYGYDVSGDNTVIDGNTFVQNNYGVYIYAADSPTGLIIKSNIFTDPSRAAVYLRYYVAPMIGWNTMTGSRYTFQGMSLVGCTGAIEIKHNYIDGVGGGTGISLSSCTGTPVIAPGLTANNVIHLGGSGTSTGISVSNYQEQHIYHNSVHQANSGATRSAIAIGGGLNIDVRNNIFSNTGGGYTYSVSTVPSGFVSDYNDLYATGANLAYWGSVDQSDLAAWQAASSTDANSISADPKWVDAPNDDYHLSGNSLAIGAGTDVSITTDMDENVRPDPPASSPDIGAYEHSWAAPDITPPAAPTTLTAAVSYELVALDWDDNTEGDLDYYTVYRNTDNNTLTALSIATDLFTSTYSDNTVLNDSTYWYWVSATDSAGNASAWTMTSAVPGDYIAPAAPTGLAAAPGDRQMQLTWDPNTTDADMDSFVVYRHTVRDSTTANSIYTAGKTTTSYLDQNLDNGSTYYYWLAAVDTAGNISDTTVAVSAAPVGLVAWYPFNGNANDESANSNDGTVYGALVAADRFGNTNCAYGFDGVDDYIDIGPYAGNGVRSISVWFTPTTTIDSSSIVYSQSLIRRNTLGESGEFGIVLTNAPAVGLGSIHFSRRIDAQDYDIRSDSAAWHAREWHNVVCVLNGSTGMEMYVDGVKNQDIDPSTGPSDTRSEITSIGRNGDADGMYFNGTIDDIRIFNRALTATETDSLYRLGSWPPPAVPTGLA